MSFAGNASPRTLRAAWLVMFNQGGWWTAKELRGELKDMAKIDRQPSTLGNTLLAASNSNYLAIRRAEDGHRGHQYAVLPTCHVPRCVTVGEVLK